MPASAESRLSSRSSAGAPTWGVRPPRQGLSRPARPNTAVKHASSTASQGAEGRTMMPVMGMQCSHRKSSVRRKSGPSASRFPAPYACRACHSTLVAGCIAEQVWRAAGSSAQPRLACAACSRCAGSRGLWAGHGREDEYRDAECDPSPAGGIPAQPVCQELRTAPARKGPRCQVAAACTWHMRRVRVRPLPATHLQHVASRDAHEAVAERRAGQLHGP
jgi:hypothetical protein